MITIEVKMGNDYYTSVHGATITEALDKVKEFHTLTEAVKEIYTNKGELKEQLESGWWVNS